MSDSRSLGLRSIAVRGGGHIHIDEVLAFVDAIALASVAARPEMTDSDFRALESTETAQAEREFRSLRQQEHRQRWDNRGEGKLGWTPDMEGTLLEGQYADRPGAYTGDYDENFDPRPGDSLDLDRLVRKAYGNKMRTGRSWKIAHQARAWLRGADLDAWMEAVDALTANSVAHRIHLPRIAVAFERAVAAKAALGSLPDEFTDLGRPLYEIEFRYVDDEHIEMRLGGWRTNNPYVRLRTAEVRKEIEGIEQLSAFARLLNDAAEERNPRVLFPLSFLDAGRGPAVLRLLTGQDLARKQPHDRRSATGIVSEIRAPELL